MKEIYIHHHLGLGDHIICNGLVRNFAKKYNKIFLFVKKSNFISVSFMFNDLDNIELITVDNDDEVYKNISPKKILRVGFENLPKIINKYNCGWDESFYIQCDIDFKERWSSFEINRNLESEDILFNMLNPNNEEYCLVHSSGSDNVDRINYNAIGVDLKIIKITKNYTNNIFDYLKLIERSSQIHCIDSSFLHLVDSVKTNGLLCYHKQNKIRNSFEKHTQKKNWIVL